MKLRNVALLLLVAGAVAGCGDTPTPTVVVNPSATPAQSQATAAPNNTATVASVPPRPQVTSPTFNFLPRRGGPGTVVNLVGANFKPNTKVAIRLGTPAPVDEPLTTADVGPDGKWRATVTIPATLPSGAPIDPQNLGNVSIVAMDESNNIIVSQPFGYSGAGTPVAAGIVDLDPSGPVRDFLNSLSSDPTGKAAQRFFSLRVQNQISAGTPVASIIPLSDIPTSFEVGDVTKATDPNKASVQVKVTTASGIQHWTIGLVRELNNWRVDSITR